MRNLPGWPALALALAAAPAWGADKPVVAPPATWVHPREFPSAKRALSDQPVHVLLADRQINFTADATDVYVESAIAVDKPQGLQVLGNFSLQWNPATETVTIHKFRIVRGTTVIDLLAGKRDFTILRREASLELAALDGNLTAALQPEGLQVGDVLDIALTTSHVEPLLGGHHHMLLDAGTGDATDHLVIAARWPRSRVPAMRSQNLPAKPVMAGDALLLDASGVQPLVMPQGAPYRFRRGRQIELSDYRSWAEVSAIFAPLFTGARKLEGGSPLLAEIARIKAHSSDPVAQAGEALALVEDNVRYFYVGLGQGNFQPAQADETWRRRFGDCKGKTALLLALLDGLGIAAEPALVSSALGDGLDQRLPGIAHFDHVIVRAQVQGKAYWLDATRSGDRSLADLDVPNFHWALPIHAGSGTLERLVVPPRTAPRAIFDLRLDASKGVAVPATAHADARITGDAGELLRASLAAVPASQLDRTLKEYWHGQYSFITPETVTIAYDAASRTEHLTMSGTAAMDWNFANQAPYYEIDGSLVGWRPDYRRDAGPDQDAPFEIAYPDYAEYRETITLPDQPGSFSLDGGDVDQTIAQRQIFRQTRLDGNVVTMVARARPLSGELALAEATAAEPRLRELAKRAVYVNVDRGIYVSTIAEAQVMAATKGSTEQVFNQRIVALLLLETRTAALEEANRFVAAFPQNANAYALRARVYAEMEKFAESGADVARARAIEPGNGLAKSIDDFDKYRLKLAEGPAPSEALDLQSTVDFSRARQCERDQKFACAQTAIARVLKRHPGSADAYLLRANLFSRTGQAKLAGEQADLLVANAPRDAEALAVAATMYCSTGRCSDGMHTFARSIALRPTVTAYLNHYRYLPQSDQAGRRADIDAALKLDPRRPETLLALAEWQHDNKDAAGALATIETIIAAGDHGTPIRLRLASALADAGQADRARGIFAELRGFAEGSRNAPLYNSLCYASATHNFDLETALADCKQALAMESDSAAILDSLGFVELKLGHLDQAITAYNGAIAQNPKLYHALYGRGLALQRKGRTADANADLAAATTIRSDVRAEFAKLGLDH